jgi:hypothetical protein
MFRSTSVLGVSMVSQRNRRILVALVYFSLIAFISAGAFLKKATLFGSTGFPFILWVLLVTRYTFGKLIPNFTFNIADLEQVDTSTPESYGFNSPTPVPVKPAQVDAEPDEREKAVRNAAHFTSSRAIAIYLLLSWIAIVFAQDASIHLATFALPIAIYVVLAAVVMAFTLPQAIILWNEPDLPEER